MKAIFPITACLAIILLAGSGCRKDKDAITGPCLDVHCVHGECQDGSCLCDNGYGGADCSRELTPRWIGVGKITLTGMFHACNDWDKDGWIANDADVYIRLLHEGNEVYNARDWAQEDTSCSHGCTFPRVLSINHPTDPYTLEIYDRDEDGDERIASITFSPWQALRGRKQPASEMVFHSPQQCSIGLVSNSIPVSIFFEDMIYSF